VGALAEYSGSLESAPLSQGHASIFLMSNGLAKQKVAQAQAGPRADDGLCFRAAAKYCSTVVRIVPRAICGTYGQRLQWCLVGSFSHLVRSSEGQFTTLSATHDHSIQELTFLRSDVRMARGTLWDANALHFAHFCGSLQFLDHSQVSLYYHHQITPTDVDAFRPCYNIKDNIS
jgi:hypothetical protein